MVRLACGIVVVMALAPIQQPANPQPAPAGVIAGVLVSDNGQPVRKAQVTAILSSPRATKTATSDAEGRFQLTGLAPGEYRLYAEKPGFLSRVHGASRLGSNQTGA